MRRGERLAEHVEVATVAADTVHANDDARVVRRAPFVIHDAMKAMRRNPAKVTDAWRGFREHGFAYQVSGIRYRGSGITAGCASVGAQRALEDEQHRGRRAPDVTVQPWNGPVIAARRPEHPEMPLVIRAIEDEFKRHLEYVGDFHGVRRERDRRIDPSDDGQHAITADGFVSREPTEDLH